MKIGRIATSDGIYLVRVEDADERVATPLVRRTDGDTDLLRHVLDSQHTPTNLPSSGAEIALSECRLLPPIAAPRKIICIGLNYLDHAQEAGLAAPEEPLCFAKTVNTVIGTEDAIRCPERLAHELDYEAEIAVIMAREARSVPRDQALDFVLGYTLCNDVSARDAQFANGQWFRGKSVDTFLPLGPWIVPAYDLAPDAIEFSCRLNGTIMQDSTTANMIFDVATLVSYISSFLTLEPGDVIATGTPAGVGYSRTPPVYLRDGDTVEVYSRSLGLLRNTVRVLSNTSLSAVTSRGGKA